jgi:P27 family predicted phage terminase small subunit
MPRGRKKKPTKIKELQGTLKAERVVENEMTATLVTEIPNPPNWLTEIGKEEYIKVCNELYQKQMLHKIDMRLIEAYCNAMALHIEMEMLLRDKGRIQVYRDENGNVKHTQSTPYQTIADKALDKALKIATQFGLTPSARSSISQPTLIQQNNEYNFFE